jgi:hypothetical protein
MSTLTPLRTQYLFDLSGVKFKSRSDILTMQRQWETFERVENYNDVIYQRFGVGNRGLTYYQFRDRSELNDYRIGQQLHEQRYPTAPAGTFASISTRAMPDVPVLISAPNYTYLPPRDINPPGAVPAGVITTTVGDMSIYTYVSSFNATHYFKYNFVSDEERLAYHRAERIVRMMGAV